MSSQAWDLSLEVRCDRAAPSRVRHALSERADIGWVGGDLMLVASELVTNAVQHSGAGEDDVVGVAVKFAADSVVLSVCDPGCSDGGPQPRRDDAVLGGGFGLHLVDQLCERWGSEKRGGRHRVWAELRAAAP